MPIKLSVKKKKLVEKKGRRKLSKITIGEPERERLMSALTKSSGGTGEWLTKNGKARR